MAVRNVGATTPSSLQGTAPTTVSWNLYVTYEFAFIAFQWVLGSGWVGRTFTLTFDGATVATGVTTATTSVTFGTPIAVTPGAHTMSIAYSGTGTVAHALWTGTLPLIPANEVFSASFVAHNIQYPLPAIYTIDSVQGATSAVLLESDAPAGTPTPPVATGSYVTEVPAESQVPTSGRLYPR